MVGRTFALHAAQVAGHGVWLTHRGQRFWRLAVRSEGAQALRLHLEGVDVGAGKIWIYGAQNPGEAYTGRGLHGDGEFWSNVVLGNEVILEYQAADGASSEIPFTVRELSAIERWPHERGRAPAARMAAAENGERNIQACHLDATCYLDRDNLREVIHAGVQYFWSGSRGAGFCSGTMLNVGGLSGDPYMMTATHCLPGDAEARTLAIFTDHESTSCNGPVRDIRNRLGESNPGRVIAASPAVEGDITLVRLTKMPSGQRTLARWNENALPNGTRLAIVGHPDTQYRRIAFATRTSDWTSTSMDAKVVEGAVEEGNSGGGVFARQADGGWALVGVTSGGWRPGPAHCSGGAIAILGRLDSFYPAIRNTLRPAVPAPVIRSFTATPPSIRAGESSMLKWSVTGVTDVIIPQAGLVRADGEFAVAPSSTTTYRLIAENSGGRAEGSVTVTVASTTATLAAVTSPANGSTLPGRCVPFRWSAAANAREYYMEAGSAVAGTNYVNLSLGLDTAREICGFPADGSPVFVRLWTKLPPEDWRWSDYRYTAAAGGSATSVAQLTSPGNGSVLPGACTTFRWSAGNGATEYFIEAGREEGSTHYANFSVGLALAREICGLPTDGSSVHLRLWTKLPPEDWRSVDYRFQTAAIAPPVAVAAMTSPAPNSTLTGACVTFRWNGVPNGREYYLDIGATDGGIEYASVTAGLNLSREVCGLPTNGSNVSVRLWTLLPGDDWRSADYRYRAYTPPQANAAADLTLPAVGTQLVSDCTNFAWTAGVGATQYRLVAARAGSNLQAFSFYDENLGSRLTAQVCGIPQVGGKIDVTLWSNPGGTWTGKAYIFTTGTAGMGFANGDFESAPNPAPGSWITLRQGDAFGRWIVGGHSIDIHNGQGTDFARSGRQSVDLSGEAAGSILQTISTQPGQRYRITFWYAGHPYHPYSGDAAATVSWGYRGSPDRQTLRISRPGSDSDQRLNWVSGTFDVTAEFGESFLTFTSNSPNDGIVLDDVRVVPIP